MKTLTSLLLLVSFLGCLAQNPEGRLYTLSHCGNHLGYIEYPGGNYVFLDSLGGTDLLFYKNRLFVAGTPSCQQAQQVYVFDVISGSLDTVLDIHGAQKLAIWEEYLLVSTLEPPFLQAFDLEDLSPGFSLLDSSHLIHAPTSVEVWEDRAFLLLTDRIAVVDLDLQDTLAIVPTPPPFSFGGGNRFMVQAEPHLYVEVEYATGLIRSSLLRLEMRTLEFDTLFHIENYASWLEPVVAEDGLFLYHFDSHYDIAADSLYINPVFSSYYPLAYDPESETFFLAGPGNSLKTWSNGQMEDSTFLPGSVTIACFSPAQRTVIEKGERGLSSLQVYPNPASDRIFVHLPSGHLIQAIRLLNSRGQMLMQHTDPIPQATVEMDLSGLSRGGYFVEVITQEKKYSAPVVKW